MIKLATNDRLYAQMIEDMDLNCGDIISEGVSIADKGAELLELIIKTPPTSRPRARSSALGIMSLSLGKSAL